MTKQLLNTYMALTDEIQHLANLRAFGALTEAEFKQAKAKLLQEEPTDYFRETMR